MGAWAGSIGAAGTRPRLTVSGALHAASSAVEVDPSLPTRGRLPLEGRIDLHGMFQSEAHAVLLDFLLRAHERGLRHVLVITGKGRSIGSDGALKRAVPMWFSKPEYRHLISSYEDASANHVGDGALYVRLARRRGEKS